MNRNIFFLITAFFALSGCGSEKNAEYYSKHPDELKPLIEECEAKIKSVKKSEEMDALLGDKTCTMVEQAVKAVELGGMDKVVVNEARGTTFWDMRIMMKQSSIMQWEQSKKERAQAREQLENLKRQGGVLKSMLPQTRP